MAAESTPFTFLQVSDVHLDSSFGGSKIRLTAAKRKERKAEMLEALSRVFAVAIQRRVDAVIIPGDLFDAETVSSQTVNQVIELCLAAKDIFIVIAPGNHDYYSADSMYNQEALAARGMRLSPSNVFIFKNPEFETVQHPKRSDVSFSGRAFAGNVQIHERLLSAVINRDKRLPLDILLFHGSLDSYTGCDSGFPGKLTAPFSAQELTTQGFAYTAVGHYHHVTEIRSTEGKLLGAYSGCLVGRGLDEAGPRYCLFGTMVPKPGNTREWETSIEPVELDKRRIVTAVSDLTGKTASEILAEISASLSQKGAREGQDIIYLGLTGRYPAGGEPDYIPEKLSNYYHLEIDDNARQDYLIQACDERTTEGKFIAYLTRLKQEAEAAGGRLETSDIGCPIDAATIDDALYFGLDALKQKRITVRHVD